MLHLRGARPDDVDLILAFIAELAAFERAPERAVATPDDLRRWVFGPDAFVRVVIAEWAGAPAGFAVWFLDFSTWQGKPGLYLEDLFVRADHRGIGAALLAHLAQICVERGYCRYQWQVLDWNTDAIAFYEARGARTVREWIHCRIDGDALVALARG